MPDTAATSVCKNSW